MDDVYLLNKHVLSTNCMPAPPWGWEACGRGGAGHLEALVGAIPSPSTRRLSGPLCASSTPCTPHPLGPTTPSPTGLSVTGQEQTWPSTTGRVDLVCRVSVEAAPAMLWVVWVEVPGWVVLGLSEERSGP